MVCFRPCKIATFTDSLDLIRSITDPEHPLTLEQLAVVSTDQIDIDHERNLLTVHFTPTVSHCSLATLIGLSLRVRLLRALPERLKVDIFVQKGTHQSEMAVNKQLNDKERVAAALENGHLLDVVNQCLANANLRGQAQAAAALEAAVADVPKDDVLPEAAFTAVTAN